MATTTTPNVALTKNTTGTSEPWSNDSLNSNWDKVDAAIGPKTALTATITVSNSVSETSLGFVVVPTPMSAGMCWDCEWFGTYDNSAVAATLTLRMKLGGTTLTTMTISTPAVAQTNQPWSVQGRIVCIATGAPGSFRSRMFNFLFPVAGPVVYPIIPSAAAAISTASPLNFELTAQWSAAAAANTLRRDAGFGSRASNA